MSREQCRGCREIQKVNENGFCKDCRAFLHAIGKQKQEGIERSLLSSSSDTPPPGRYIKNKEDGQEMIK